MSKKICFSSVLKERKNPVLKHNAQPSLRQMFQEYSACPNGDFTLRYAQTGSIRNNNPSQDFEEGFNPLDKWIQSQIHSNKQNMADTQPRRHMAADLFKFTNTNKSPHKLTQARPDFTGQSSQAQGPQRNLDMKEIAMQYRKSGKDFSREAPVWRFSSRNDTENDQMQESEARMPQNGGHIGYQQVRESIAGEKFKQKAQLAREQNQMLSQQFTRLKQEKISQAAKLLPEKQAKGQNLLAFIQQVKDNLAHEIEVIAERIIQDKKASEEQDQQLLISQRESIENREQDRLNEARKQINQYLSLKQQSGSIKQKEPITSLNKAPLVSRKPSSKEEERIPQQTPGSPNQQVGYSFASDFHGSNLPHESPESPNESRALPQNKASNQSQNPRTNERNQSVVSNQISLPNIDEVKSQHEGLQKVRDDFVEDSVAITCINRNRVEHQSIDKNFIKEIQSVAYNEPEKTYTLYRQENQKFSSPQVVSTSKSNFQAAKPKLSPQISDNKTSLMQRIQKTAMSIEDEQEANQVNNSVVEEQTVFGATKSKEASAETRRQRQIVEPRVQNFVLPANPVRIQFKKATSPDHGQRRFTEGNTTAQIAKPNPTSTYNISSGYFTTYNPSAHEQVPSNQPKSSFSNVIQDAQKQSTRISPTSSTTKTPGLQINLGGNQMKNSSNQEGRKLKITISPKYQGAHEQDRQDQVTVNDFRLGANRAEEEPQTNTIRTSFASTLVSPTSALPSKQSYGSITGKFKVDSMFPNSGALTVVQTKETRQVTRDSGQALIKTEKYEKFEAVVETVPLKSSVAAKANQSIKRSGQFEFDLDF